MDAPARLRRPELAFRCGEVGDVVPLVTEWARAMRKAPPFDLCTDDVFFPEARRGITRILEHASVTIAHDANVPDNFYGLIVHERFEGVPVIHWAFTVYRWRRSGIFRELLAEAGIDPERPFFFTHAGWSAHGLLKFKRIGRSRTRRKYPGVFNPWLVMRYL